MDALVCEDADVEHQQSATAIAQIRRTTRAGIFRNSNWGQTYRSPFFCDADSVGAVCDRARALIERPYNLVMT